MVALLGTRQLVERCCHVLDTFAGRKVDQVVLASKVRLHVLDDVTVPSL